MSPVGPFTAPRFGRSVSRQCVHVLTAGSIIMIGLVECFDFTCTCVPFHLLVSFPSRVPSLPLLSLSSLPLYSSGLAVPSTPACIACLHCLPARSSLLRCSPDPITYLRALVTNNCAFALWHPTRAPDRPQSPVLSSSLARSLFLSIALTWLFYTFTLYVFLICSLCYLC